MIDTDSQCLSRFGSSSLVRLTPAPELPIWRGRYVITAKTRVPKVPFGDARRSRPRKCDVRFRVSPRPPFFSSRKGPSRTLASFLPTEEIF